MPGDEVAGRRAGAVHDVHDARREAGLLDQVAHEEAGQRRLLAEFHDDGAAHGQRRAELPGLHEEREVPGDDLANDADGLVPREAEGAAAVLRRLDHLAAHLVRPAGVVPEAFDHQADVDAIGHVLRLPVVQGLHLRQPVPVLLHEVRELEQQVPASGAVGAPPSLEGLIGRRHSEVHVLLTCLLDRRDLALVDRVDGVEALLGLGIHPLVVDEELRAEWQRLGREAALLQADEQDAGRATEGARARDDPEGSEHDRSPEVSAGRSPQPRHGRSG
mmetsp:Transcript_22745/g.60039  ORF Transcript_22745/g.60039 Transcript_22745/m.60039 type:complete len:275 (-) Transcript_22745:32-856(-)